MGKVIDLRHQPDNLPTLAWEPMAPGSTSSTTSRAGRPSAAALTDATYEGWAPSGAAGRLTYTFNEQKFVDAIYCVTIEPQPQSLLQLYTRIPTQQWQPAGYPVPAGGATVWLIEDANPIQQFRVEAMSFGPRTYVAKVWAGLTTKLERPIYVGHSPGVRNRRVSRVQGLSETGRYLGAIERRRTYQTQVSVDDVEPEWFRRELDPFFDQAAARPHAFVWRNWVESPGFVQTEDGDLFVREDGTPIRYALAPVGNEAIYCWVDGDPDAGNSRPNGMMSASWSVTAVGGNDPADRGTRPFVPWILQDGKWNDNGIWKDAAIWIDS